MVAILAGSTAFIAALAGGLRWWTRKDENGQPRAFPRRLSNVVDRAVHTLIGRDAIMDPDSGKELKPAQPGIGERIGRVETTQHEISATLGSLSSVVEELAQTNAKVVRIHERLDGHEERIVKLEEGAAERIVSRAESAEAFRAIANVAEQKEK